MKTSKPVSAGQVVLVIVVAVLLIASIAVLSIYIGLKNSDDESALNKDVALSALYANDALTGSYNDKKIIIPQKELIFEMLKADEWKYLPEYGDSFNASLIFYINREYTVSLDNDRHAAVTYEEKTRYYSVPADVFSNVSAFLIDNTFISAKDASAVLAASENITVSVLGSSKTVSSGAQLASALKISEWTESDGVKPASEPIVIIDTRNGLKINVYKSINIGVIEYSGTETVYSVDELSVASAELVAKSYFNEVASLFEGKTDSDSPITIRKGEEEFNISPDTSIDTLLDVTKWERRFKAPAGLPSIADITVNNGASFSVDLYSAHSVAEFENAYYSVPSSVFSAINDLLRSRDDSPETVTELKTTLTNAISEKKQLFVKYKKNGYVVSVLPDFLTVLSISSWTDSPVLELMGDPDLVFEINSVPELSLCFYTSKNSVSVINGSKNQVYRVSSSVTDALIKYIQENLYTEAWTISATELGALQKNAEGVDVTVTDLNAYREKFSEETDEALTVLAAIDLLPSDVIPETVTAEKTEILFKGSERFLMTLYPDTDGKTIVNVTGTFYARGKYIDRWFTCSSAYSDVVNSLMEVNAKALDTAAALFCESLRTGDTDTINRLIGNSSFDYSGIKSLMLNHLSIINSDGSGAYTVRLNVEDPVDSPFEKGIKDYILTVGSSGGSLSVISFMPEDEYNTLNLNDPAVSAVDGFTSWVDAAGQTFDSIDSFDNKSAVVSYLMMLCKRDGSGSVSEENPSLLRGTQDELNAAALKYFGVETVDSSDIPSYNPETGMYSYEGISAPTRYKRVFSLSYDDDGTAHVGYKWYSDPLCLYCVDTLEYTLKKSGDDTFAIISAKKPKDENGQDNPVTGPSGNQPEQETPEDVPSENPGDSTEPENGEAEEPSFSPPTGLTPTETMFKYFEYINEKDTEKANSLLYEAYARSEEEYSFDEITKISVTSCAEVPSDYAWYDPWYKSPAAYVCVIAEVLVDSPAEKWQIYDNGTNSVEIYMIKTSESADWRIIVEKPGGEGILGDQ